MHRTFRFSWLIIRLGAVALLLAQAMLIAGLATGYGLPRGDLLAFSVPINPISQWYIMLMDVRSRLMIRVADYSWRLAVSLSWSPDGSKIAFATYSPRSDIFVVDVFHGEVRNFTNDWAEDRYPAWSPDGQHIAFFSNRDYLPAQRYDIYLLNTADGTAERLTYNEALYPNWSPDGSDLVYSSRTEGNLYRLNVACVQRPEGCGGSHVHLTKTLHDDRNPIWSPDGQSIAFLSFVEGGTGEQIFIINRDGSNLRLLASGWRFQGMPSWSPDGRWLAFVGKARTEQTDSLYVADMRDASQPQQLVVDTYYAYNERWPMWSPDSRYIAFSHRKTGGLYRVEVSTGHVDKLSDVPATYPVWQP